MTEPPPPQTPRRPPVNWRSVALGLVGVSVICGLTPYNDYALNNTFLVGNNLPIGVVMLTFLFAVLVNAPLHRFAPRQAFSAGELTVALAMTLVSCALPSSGLMRYFPPVLVAPFWHAQTDRNLLDVLTALRVKPWIFPRFAGAGPTEWTNDPVVQGYVYRWTGNGPPPYGAWVRPAVAWGVFLFALYGAMFCMVAIVRRQWNDNERLPFPLAQIHLALVEQPERGAFLSPVLRRRSFWVAFAMVFLLHLWNGLHLYDAKDFPEIPVHYDLHELFTEPPWKYTDPALQVSKVYFTVVGVTYFLPSGVSFSLWFFFLFDQAHKMLQGQATGDPAMPGRPDEHFGAVVAFVLSVLWVGRAHWALVVRQAFRGARRGEPRGRYLPYPVAFWGLVGCWVVMVGWLALVGTTVIGAAVVVTLLLLLFFAIARIIAETGLVHGQLKVPLNKPWDLMAEYGAATPVPLTTYFMSAMVNAIHYDYREVVPVYATHAMKVADQTIFGSHAMGIDTPDDRRTGRRFVAAMFLALLVGYGVSFGSTLWTEYRYAATRDVQAKAPINDWGILAAKYNVLNPSDYYARHDYALSHSPAAHLAGGFAVAAFLAFMRLRFTWWPLHPIGFIMIDTFPGDVLWLSILIGWLTKAMVLRFGGPKLYTNAKTFFIGMIVGESLAAGFWLAMGIALSAMNVTYRPVNIMPG